MALISHQIKHRQGFESKRSNVVDGNSTSHYAEYPSDVTHAWTVESIRMVEYTA